MKFLCGRGLMMLFVLVFVVLAYSQCVNNPAEPSCFVTGLGLMAMNLTGQPPSPSFEMGMLGSVAIDGSPSGCQNVNIGEQVEPNVFDGLGESFTVEAWIMHPNPSDGQYKPFLSRHPGKNLGNEESEFTFQIQREGNINFFTGCGNFWQYGFQVGLKDDRYPLWKNFTMQPNTWTHVAAVVQWEFDTYGINFGLVTLYANGELIDQKPWGSNDEIGACTARRRSRAVGQPVRIGYYDNSDAGVQTFGGVIDEIRIWNSTRTQLQIQQHMHGLFFDKTNLIAYFGFSEGYEAVFPSQNPVNLQHSYNQANSMWPCASGMFDSSTGQYQDLPWVKSGLKIHNAPITTIVRSGSASGQLFGVDFTDNNFINTFDYWVTGMLFTTDAKAYYSSNGTRTEIRPPFPIFVSGSSVQGSLQFGDQIEYAPGDRAGIDIILYKARSPTDGVFEANYSPGTNSTTDCCHGNTKMTFRVLCPPGPDGIPLIPDRCGICGGNNTCVGQNTTLPDFCPCCCSAQGGTLDQCGNCVPSTMCPSSDCRGCDCVPNSGATVDCCGICGGTNVNFTQITNCTITDNCLVPLQCRNATCNQCEEYKTFPTARMDYVLLTQSLKQILLNLQQVGQGIDTIDGELPSNNQFTNAAISAQILALNNLCMSAGMQADSLQILLNELLANSGGPCGPVPKLPCNENDIFF